MNEQEKTAILDQLFPFQRALIEWACRKGRSAILADTGLYPQGDDIDRGLILRRLLEEGGFGVVLAEKVRE
jgi:hypothetical protein